MFHIKTIMMEVNILTSAKSNIREFLNTMSSWMSSFSRMS